MERRTNRVVSGVLWSAALASSGLMQAQQYVISTYAGGGFPSVKPISATTVKFGSFGKSIAADAAGNVYFGYGPAIFKLDTRGSVTRVAGTGVEGFSGDGGPATLARLASPSAYQSIAATTDRAGNLFIADSGNRRVRRVSPDGIITTIAGGGQSGSAGDGGPAIDAQLGQLAGLAIDRIGNVFIADSDNNVVREVTVDGIINTVAGVAHTFPAGFSGDGGPAKKALLFAPSAVAVDFRGNVFIADSGNHRIRKVSPDGIITTVAGNDTRALNGQGAGDSGSATDIWLDWPTGLAVDDQGDFFIADPSFAVIRKVTPGGMLTPVVGNGSHGYSGDGGPATKAQLSTAWNVAVDGQNNVFIFDGPHIRKVTSGGTISTVAGGGSVDLLIAQGNTATTIALQLALPQGGLTVSSGVVMDDNGNLFVAETAGGVVRKISPNGAITTVAGSGPCTTQSACPLGDGGPATFGYLHLPVGLGVDGKGNLYIADYSNIRVRKVSPDGNITTVAGNGTLGYSGDGGKATDAALSVANIAVDKAGNIFLADGAHIRKVSTDGIITTVAGGGTCTGPACEGGRATDAYLGPTAVAVDATGNLFIADITGDDYGCYNYIRKVSADGTITTLAGLPGTCWDESGDGGPAVAAALGFSFAIAVDSAGNIFFTEVWGNRIRRISTDGIITTVVGGPFGYSGDGGPASNAMICYPIAVAAGTDGNVYFSDAVNQVVRVLRPMNHPVVSAVVDAASEKTDPVTPGKIVVLYGAGLGPASLIQNQPRDLPAGKGFGTTVGDVSVTFNSISAPVLYASSTQVAAVVPYGLSGTTAQVQVTYLGDVSNSLSVPAAAIAPSWFTLNQSGAGEAAAINVSNGKPNTAANPVRIGDYITLYATGEGQTTPPGVDGKVIDSTSVHPAQPWTVTVDGIQAPVQYAGGAPGLVAGVLQVNVQIPPGVRPGGYVPVVLQVGNSSTTAGAVWIAISGN